MAEQKQRVRQLSSHNISVYVVRVADIWADVPPLGVVLCVAIVLDTLYVSVALGRYLGEAGDDVAKVGREAESRCCDDNRVAVGNVEGVVGDDVPIEHVLELLRVRHIGEQGGGGQGGDLGCGGDCIAAAGHVAGWDDGGPCVAAIFIAVWRHAADESLEGLGDERGVRPAICRGG